MPHPYPPEFPARAIAVVRSGKQIKQTAYELGISGGCLHEWLKQDRIDRGEAGVLGDPDPVFYRGGASTNLFRAGGQHQPSVG